jgi:hypothetical protein
VIINPGFWLSRKAFFSDDLRGRPLLRILAANPGDGVTWGVMVLNRDRLEDLYNQRNRPEFISPDPLETLSPYHDVRDREVAALFAASMAYGRVNAILPPLRRVLAVMGVSPAAYVRERREPEVVEDMQGIVHRFARPVHLAALSAGIGSVLRNRGSLEASFLGGHGSGGVWSGLKSLESDLRSGAQGDPVISCPILPVPLRASGFTCICGGWSGGMLWIPGDGRLRIRLI